MLRTARLIAGKDLRLERNSRVAAFQVLPFALLLVVLFAFAFDADSKVLVRAAPGLFWIAVLLSLFLAVGRMFIIETADGALDALRLSSLDPAGIFLGKAAALLIELLVLEVVLLVGVLTLYDVSVPTSGLVLLVTAAVATSVGLVATGTLYGVLSAGTTVRETLLPLLIGPVVAPLLIGASRAFEAALGTRRVVTVLETKCVTETVTKVSEGWPWAGLLTVFALVYVAAGLLAFGALLEDA
jgi:heme exporter protein B